MGGIKIVCTKNWTYGVEVCSFFVVKKSWLAINFNDFLCGISSAQTVPIRPICILLTLCVLADVWAKITLHCVFM